MNGQRYRHIFLAGPPGRLNFTNPRQGGSKPRIPERNRSNHSGFLLNRLQEAWNEFQERQSVSHVTQRGVYLEFKSDPGFDLVIQSLENLRFGIRVLNVRTEGDGENEITFATVYVPFDQRGYFLRKIEAYASENLKSGRPKNASLINSISDIRLAVLESFWREEERSLIPQVSPDWIEVWLSSDEEELIFSFNELLGILGVESEEGVLKFPERVVKLIYANREQLNQLIINSDIIAEFRAAKEVSTFYIELENQEQLKYVQQLLQRTTYVNEENIAVCILDTGVNNGHLLIQPVLDARDMHSVISSWGTSDEQGHGTLMSGIITYGDLLDILQSKERIRINYALESCKILPPGQQSNPKKLWGYYTSQGISLAEIQSSHRKRIICMAISSIEDRDRGRPSSWSGTIDVLTSGYEDDSKRLIILSAGNNETYINYPTENLTNEVNDPGQSWNALTVGAYTEKISIRDHYLRDYNPIAPAGGLSPYSTTSLNWPSRKWPIKPDVVFEGGNVARGPNDSIYETDDLKLLSLFRDPQVAQFAPFNATSAATAHAARMAAEIQYNYPNAWPETVRALVVHSADWTDTMKDQFLQGESKTEYAKLLRICGYGKPDYEKALYCLSNSLTMISQAEIQPYDKVNNRYVTRDMHLYNLPWPSDILTELGEEQVILRVTLSYFIEPSPGEIGWENRYRYASHGLRFDINGPGESENEFKRRINRQARDEDGHPGTSGVQENWTIGEARNVGSIHSDIWRGRAVDLANSNMIAIYPTVGWWRERHHLNRWNRRCRYSLVVSIETREQDIDIYTPVAVQIGIGTPIAIPIDRSE